MAKQLLDLSLPTGIPPSSTATTAKVPASQRPFATTASNVQDYLKSLTASARVRQKPAKPSNSVDKASETETPAAPVKPRSADEPTGRRPRAPSLQRSIDQFDRISASMEFSDISPPTTSNKTSSSSKTSTIKRSSVKKHKMKKSSSEDQSSSSPAAEQIKSIDDLLQDQQSANSSEPIEQVRSFSSLDTESAAVKQQPITTTATDNNKLPAIETQQKSTSTKYDSDFEDDIATLIGESSATAVPTEESEPIPDEPKSSATVLQKSSSTATTTKTNASVRKKARSHSLTRTGQSASPSSSTASSSSSESGTSTASVPAPKPVPLTITHADLEDPIQKFMEKQLNEQAAQDYILNRHNPHRDLLRTLMLSHLQMMRHFAQEQYRLHQQWNRLVMHTDADALLMQHKSNILKHTRFANNRPHT